MKCVEVLNFQNLYVEDTLPIEHHSDKDKITVVFVRDPYEYFDYLLFDYLSNSKSLLFAEDIIVTMKKLNDEAFVDWLNSLNFTPFYNPQTFKLDRSKRSLEAIENMEKFDYVVPYDEIDIFLENVELDITVIKKQDNKMIFSMTTQRENRRVDDFLKKDIELYERSVELWNITKQRAFKPLKLTIKQRYGSKPHHIESKSKGLDRYKGTAGYITANSIGGWVYHKESEDVMMVAVYKNSKFLYVQRADIYRADLVKLQIHPTGRCGFDIEFDEVMFQKGDSVVVLILPEKIELTLSPSAKEFLGII